MYIIQICGAEITARDKNTTLFVIFQAELWKIIALNFQVSERGNFRSMCFLYLRLYIHKISMNKQIRGSESPAKLCFIHERANFQQMD